MLGDGIPFQEDSPPTSGVPRNSALERYGAVQREEAIIVIIIVIITVKLIVKIIMV